MPRSEACAETRRLALLKELSTSAVRSLGNAIAGVEGLLGFSIWTMFGPITGKHTIPKAYVTRMHPPHPQVPINWSTISAGDPLFVSLPMPTPE